MLRLKRWIAATLAACLLINIIPVNTFAETEKTTPEVIEPSSTAQSDSEVVEPTSEVAQTLQTSQEPQQEMPIQESPAEETQPQETTSEETEITAPSQNAQGSSEQLPGTESEEITEETITKSRGVNEIQLAAEGMIPTIGDTFADSFINELNKNNISTTITKGEDGVITLTIGQGQGEILALLSKQTQTADSNYQNWNINFDFTGELSLPDTFKGLGDWGETAESQFPFKGNFTGKAITIVSSKTIFKALHASANLNNNQIQWKIPDTANTPTIPILTQVLVADKEERTINMPLSSANRFNPYIGQLIGGIGQVTLPELNYSNVGTSPAVEYPGDVGLICCSMAASTNLQVRAVTLPSSVSLNLKSIGSVGSLVGSMGDNATLTITKALALNATLNGVNAGGLVGSMTSATIDGAEGETVKVNATLTATEAAGGIAGVAITGTRLLGANANVVLQSVKANGTLNSGVLYGICTATGGFKPLNGVTFSDSAVREVSGPGNCGGLFGTLTLRGNEGKCIISGTESTPLGIISTLSAATNKTQYGGITGTLISDTKKNALVVKQCDITSTVTVGTDTGKYPKFIGGIVALQGENTTVDASNSTVTLSNPRTPVNTYGIGGLCASVGDRALLKANTMTVVIDSFLENQGSSGVAASTGKGAIVYLENSLDLSAALLTTCAYSGQIVGRQDCSLIYAPNVEIERLMTTSGTTSYSGVELDDIGNYGELYRINSEDANDSSKKPFLSVGEDYSVTFNYELKKGDNGYVLSTKEDYACLALSWQSRGYFPTIDGITNTNWSTSDIKSSTITLGADIDLTDCGIGGLTRDYDNDSVNDTFTGTFVGNNKTLTLDIGATNVNNNVTTGDGRIYWHNATGLFAVLSSTAMVSDLMIAGSIHLSNNKLSPMYSGALAAQMNGNRAEGSTLSQITTKVTFDAKVNGANTLYLGGLIGLISGGVARISFNTGTNLKAKVDITHSDNGSANHFGGAIGGIAGGASAYITCSGATIGGSIVSTGTVNNLYAGGLIGTIWPATNSSTRNIDLTNLKVTGFTLTGKASERMGGILGGIWAGTDVTVSSLTVSNTTLTASGAAALGGLVYRASGKWTVSSIDLSGQTISASSASALGLLVCHGEPYRDAINGSNQNMNGLYLEMIEHWDWNESNQMGYAVPIGITFSGSVFDEFVAYTAYRNNDTNYDITHNGSGIISLQTDNSTVNMTEGERNTYVNRTAVGLSKKTNLYSRYYYNLPNVKVACTGGNIDTAEELLIWSVYRYAATNLKQHFTFSGVADNNGNAVSNIGGNSDTLANFDMNGLSYYPISITNSDVTVQYADVQFYNDDIETKEVGNKLTREDSQHYTMHCALFLNFTAENITQTVEHKMTVNGVTFAGTVGVVNGGSGALICGRVSGVDTGTHTAVCKVVLADADIDTKAVKLNGISVDSTAEYCPVLINRFEDYSALEANYITTEQTSKAGSSLFGQVEKSDSSSAVNVSIVLEGTIKLNETKDAVFSQATLFHSLHFSDGSASYNFNKDKDYDNSNKYLHNATHGKELAEGVSVEYAGLQGNYLDGDPVIVNNAIIDFSGYLPYVAYSPANEGEDYKLENNWHEVAVNVRFTDLTKGCGTYGHPYLVNADTLRSVANYINSGRASNGWQLCVPINLAVSSYHIQNNAQYDVVVTYQNGKFWNGDTEYSGNVREHLQSAVYQINEDIELKNFSGIGSKDTSNIAFKGVIYGNNKTITLSGGSSAFIKYSYGSVVRDVNFILNQAPTLNRTEPARPNEVTEAKRAPDTFFGGVIGCVLGGDNIIENVTVFTGNAFNINPTGSNPYLVPIGGHVGIVAGGGVIFRGICTSNYDGDDNYYRNRFIGRVLGGYAFYEGTNTVPNNGDSKDGQNYKINKITSSQNDLNWDSNTSTLTVNNAQGLLLLSAIVSSGAGSSNSVAYTNGVAHNAAYNQIGKSEAEASTDFDLAQLDKCSTASYLLMHFSNCTTRVDFCTSGTEGINIKFATGENGDPITFNMGSYGNGYRGLSARYVSNAAYTTNGVDASTVVLRMKSFDGQETTVQNINMNVKEYDNDDFHTASMGGIFNIVWTKKSGGGNNNAFAKNLILKDCQVSLQYFDMSNNPKIQADKSTFADEDGLNAVAVGGFIGSVSDVGISLTPNNKNSNYLFSNIHIDGTPPESENSTKNCTVTGPTSAGGLIGASAMTSSKVTGYPGKVLSNGQNTCYGPNFLNCSYSNVDITGVYAAGGLIGVACASNAAPHFSSLGNNNSNLTQYLASSTVTQNGFILGENSMITAKGRTGMAGGIFGIVGMRLGINYPSVNGQTGLSVATSEQMHKFSLNGVNIISSKDGTTLYGSNGKVNGADTNQNQAASGGAVGRISNVNPTYFYDVSLNNCEVLSENTATTQAYAGGIVSNGYTNSTIVIQNCEVNNTTVSSTYAGGLIARGDNSGFKLDLADCKLEDSSIKGRIAAGGIVGTAGVKDNATYNQTYNLFNVLVKNTTVKGTDQSAFAGRIFGWVEINAASNNMTINVVGISVVVNDNTFKAYSEYIKESNLKESNTKTFPDNDENHNSNRTFNGNIVYADYAGTDAEVTGEHAPYVTANPNYSLVGTDKMMTGDAVGKIDGDTYNSVAARIWADSKNGAIDKKNLATYSKASTIVNVVGKTTPDVSTFQEVQGYTNEEWTMTDLPVLVLKGNDASAIEDYLNVITNGGYETANVTPTVSVYYYDKESKAFSRATDDQLNSDPASIYYENNQFHIRSRSFDNTLDRFSLVEASFTVNVNGTNRTYTVSVPVVVIRELQFDYMATFSYGKEFNKDIFTTLSTHLLESTGNPFTAYLSYQYNREQTVYREYDWQTYMDDGGSMLNVDKVLHFSSGLPAGTQMILLDSQNGNRAYQYTTSGINTRDVQISNFTSLVDGITMFQSSMADILGVTKSDKLTSGKFVETTASDGTVRLDGTYYRPYNADTDSDKDRYNLTVPDLSQKVPEENYYLVITVPNQSDASYYINGSLSSSLNWSMPSSGTQMHRYENTVDNRNNTESTYQISTGYRQTIVSTASEGIIDLSVEENKMQVKVQDTITFSNQQAYDTNDKLFLKLTANLQEYTSSENNTQSEEKQFPVGTTGTVKFYVQNGDTYYTWNGTEWKSRTGKTEAASSYPWKSNGGDMELLLSADGIHALDLSAVRQMIKGAQSDGDSQIIVTAEMDVEFGSSEVLNSAVPGSENNGTDTWTQLHYLGQISTQETSLSYSAMRVTAEDNTKYYRSVAYQAVLSMDAMQIDQLGVNPLQLVQDYQENIDGKNASCIDLTAALNLANLQNIESVLKKTNSITFTLSLQRRQGDTYVDASNASEHIGFDTGWSRTIQQDQYYKDGAIVTNDIFDGTQFTFPIKAYVFTDQKDYANYKITLTATFSTSDNSNVTVNADDAYVVYTYACIKPSFYEPKSEGSTP